MTKFKRFELVDFFKSITELNLKGYNKFILFSIDRAKNTIRQELQSYEEAEKAIYTQEFISFENARVGIIRAHAAKDEDGNFVEENGQYKIEDSVKEALKTELDKLFADNKTLIDTVNEKLLQHDTFMRAEVEISLTLVSFKHFPDAMEAKEYEVLSKFIKETPEEISNMME